jgi:hypothetical protein
MQLILSEVDSCRPQREERDSLEHWGDDGGASGQEQPNPFSVAFIDDRSNRLSLEMSRGMGGEIFPRAVVREHREDTAMIGTLGLFAIPVNDPESSYQYPEQGQIELAQEDCHRIGKAT